MDYEGYAIYCKEQANRPGLTEREINSDTITGYIKQIVEDEKGLTRDESGIYAAIERSSTLEGSGMM